MTFQTRDWAPGRERERTGSGSLWSRRQRGFQSIGVQGAEGDVTGGPQTWLHSEGVARKHCPRGGKRGGEGLSGTRRVGGVGRSQTREGKGVSGRGRSIVLEGTEAARGWGWGWGVLVGEL